MSAANPLNARDRTLPGLGVVQRRRSAPLCRHVGYSQGEAGPPGRRRVEVCICSTGGSEAQRLHQSRQAAPNRDKKGDPDTDASVGRAEFRVGSGRHQGASTRICWVLSRSRDRVCTPDVCLPVWSFGELTLCALSRLLPPLCLLPSSRQRLPAQDLWFL